MLNIGSNAKRLMKIVSLMGVWEQTQRSPICTVTERCVYFVLETNISCRHNGLGCHRSPPQSSASSSDQPPTRKAFWHQRSR